MSTQIRFEDVEVGMEIPPLRKHPTTRQLVKWAGASGDYNELHYDNELAKKQGLPGVIVHGALALSFVGQMLTDWIGPDGTLKKLGCTYKGMLLPGEDAVCSGEVIKKEVKDNERYIECKVWVQNPRGEKTASGIAAFTLP
ncbi:MAG: MaoC/PaaZ C-terminal domain-containing protein [Chloroflexota bacterium]|nr:MaoC/PaaZ C-terminal domain-containing protein [Chloroflexota bacterium]